MYCTDELASRKALLRSCTSRVLTLDHLANFFSCKTRFISALTCPVYANFWTSLFDTHLNPEHISACATWPTCECGLRLSLIAGFGCRSYLRVRYALGKFPPHSLYRVLLINQKLCSSRQFVNWEDVRPETHRASFLTDIQVMDPYIPQIDCDRSYGNWFEWLFLVLDFSSRERLNLASGNGFFLNPTYLRNWIFLGRIALLSTTMWFWSACVSRSDWVATLGGSLWRSLAHVRQAICTHSLKWLLFLIGLGRTNDYFNVSWWMRCQRIARRHHLQVVKMIIFWDDDHRERCIIDRRLDND